MQLGRKGGERSVPPSGPLPRAEVFTRWATPRLSALTGGGGGLLKAVGSSLVSWRMISASDRGWSHAGGTMLARRCFLRRSASQRGSWARCGGRRGGVVPWMEKVQHGTCDMTTELRSVQVTRTLRSSIPSSRPLGTTVTISISQRNETSAGVRPGGCGWAILDYSRLLSCHGGNV